MIHKTLLKQDVSYPQGLPAIHSASDQSLAAWDRERMCEGTTMRGLSLEELSLEDLVLCCFSRATQTVEIRRVQWRSPVPAKGTYISDYLHPFSTIQTYQKLYLVHLEFCLFQPRTSKTPCRNTKYLKYSQFRGKAS